MARTAGPRNERLRSVITSCGWTYDACAASIRAVASENGGSLPALDRTTVAHWISGTKPVGSTLAYLVEAVSRRLHVPVTATDLGFSAEPDQSATPWVVDWGAADVVDILLTVGRADMQRRDFARQTLYSIAALTLPLDRWSEMVGRGRRAVGGAAVGRSELDAVRETISMFSRSDERFGGGHARVALVGYLSTDVAAYLRASFKSEDARRAMFSAAAELTYLAGWKSFDVRHEALFHRMGVKDLHLWPVAAGC